MKRAIAIVCLALCAGPLASCAMSERQSAAVTPTAGRTCFTPREVRSWREEGPLSVLVRARRGDVYRARLLSPCFDLTSANRIVIEPRTGPFICELDEADIIVPGGSSGPSHCRADRFHKLTPEELAALPKNKRP